MDTDSCYINRRASAILDKHGLKDPVKLGCFSNDIKDGGKIIYS